MWNRNVTGIIVVTGILLFDLLIFKNQNPDGSGNIPLCYLPEETYTVIDSNRVKKYYSNSPAIFKLNFYEK